MLDNSPQFNCDDDELERGKEEENGMPIPCGEKLSHERHTYHIHGACLRSVREREHRLARFEIRAIADAVERGLGIVGTPKAWASELGMARRTRED